MPPARSLMAAAIAKIVLALAACLMLAVAGCAAGSAANPGTRPSSTRALAKAYLKIAEPANHRLDVEVDKYDDQRHHDLAAAESALRAQAATERQFDQNLAAIGFPPPIAATARALIRVNEIRARLAERQARAGSISELLSFTGARKLADAQVEAQVKVIRAQLGLPPPASQLGARQSPARPVKQEW